MDDIMPKVVKSILHVFAGQIFRRLFIELKFLSLDGNPALFWNGKPTNQGSAIHVPAWITFAACPPITLSAIHGKSQMTTFPSFSSSAASKIAQLDAQ
jgi:hypothetical protein